MSKKNQTPDRSMEDSGAAVKAPRKKKKGSGLLGRIVRRFFLLLFTTVILVVAALCLAANLVFKGPSPAAQKILTMTLLEPSATKWIPGLFIGDERVAEIRSSVGAELADDVTKTDQVVINRNTLVSGTSDEWAKYPDGIRFADYAGDTYNAHIMVVRDPSQVYLGLAYYDGFSLNKLGKRANNVIEEEGALAIVNGGAFNDDGTGASSNGSLPQGTTFSGGECVWKTGAPPNGLKGFVGFNQDDVLVVHKDNISEAQAKELNIRDGCCFGPVLIMNGEPNMEAYNMASGYNPRTAIGQRADGAVVFVCIDGRQAGSMGGTYADIIDIMTEYGVVNACNLDGGSSSVMMYRDTYGLYGEAGQVRMMNSYSLLQSEPRRMPNYWMVRPGK